MQLALLGRQRTVDARRAAPGGGGDARRGRAQVKLVDAGFVWTEPHSRRLKLKLTVQAEVMNGAILQQAFVVEYVVEPHMCIDCTRANTNVNVWTACVQARGPGLAARGGSHAGGGLHGFW
jgi:NMD protein affecting ribosome stability and mRNA decay